MLLTQWWVFTSTFIIFPGGFFTGPAMFNFMDTLVPGGKEEDDTRFQWYTLMVITIFNVFDTIGRYLGGAIEMKAATVTIMGLLRTLFLITTTYFGLAHSGQAFFDNDMFKLINLVLFAVSNGFIST